MVAFGDSINDDESALDDFERPVAIADERVGYQLEVVCGFDPDHRLTRSECGKWRQSKRLRRALRFFWVQSERRLPIGLDIQWNIQLGEKSFIVLLDVLHSQPHQPYMLQQFC